MESAEHSYRLQVQDRVDSELSKLTDKFARDSELIEHSQQQRVKELISAYKESQQKLERQLVEQKNKARAQLEEISDELESKFRQYIEEKEEEVSELV